MADDVVSSQAVLSGNLQEVGGVLALQESTFQGTVVVDGATLLGAIIKKAFPTPCLALNLQHFTRGLLHRVCGRVVGRFPEPDNDELVWVDNFFANKR